MAFCQNCGSKLRDGAKFCEECGEPVQGKQETNGEQRKQSFEGEIKKCPNCGQPLESFSTKCSSCGYEIRGAQVSDSVKEFSRQISTITDEDQRIMLVRNFPIPNTKEDILEFMILASTNLKYKANNNNLDEALTGKKEADAWMAKLDQCYRKAELMLVDDPSFDRIKSVYEQLQKEAKKSSHKINKVNLASVIASFIIVGLGIAIIVFGIVLDNAHENSSLAQLVGCVIIVAGSVGLARKTASMLDDLICLLGALAMEVMAGYYKNGSALKICGAVVVIVIAVNLIKQFSGNKNKTNQQ